MTFFIVMFILLMQFLWKYIDDLVGKGLDTHVILELLLYASAGLIPMALPLSTLLASLMTLGNLGENNELLAMKSAGISLPRIMSPLIFLTITISVGAFFFSNNVLPYTNLKITSLLYDVKQQRPELQIKVGVFNNDIEGLSIKVGSKDPRTNLMQRIMIYDHRANEGNLMVTIADSGYIRVTDDEQYMIITLYNGTTYEEMKDNSPTRRQLEKKFPARNNRFGKQEVVLELKGFGLQRSNEDLFKSSFHAMNLNQLSRTSDSLFKEIEERKAQAVRNITTVSLLKNPSSFKRDSTISVSYIFNADSIYNTLTTEHQLRAVERALSNARQSKSYITSIKDDLYHKGKFAVRHKVEWHRKFSLSFACFVFFFIGAPLGAIIRKGGLGMPVVVSILFFVVYYIISLTGEKFAREMMWEVNTGMWVSSFILLPLGIFLSYKATTDSVILNADYYILAFKRFFLFFKSKKTATDTPVH
jgi:lipopolysaccharide export system permease protein